MHVATFELKRARFVAGLPIPLLGVPMSQNCISGEGNHDAAHTIII